MKLPDSRLHDWRHTYAVDAMRRGVKPMVVATQLGHANPTLVLKNYGKYVPDVAELRRSVVA